MINRRVLATESLLYVAALLVGLASVGCVNAPSPLPPDEQVDPQPAPTPGPSVLCKLSEVSEAIARRIDAGSFRHSDELLQTVEGMVAAKELSEPDGSRIIDACPGIRGKRRALTADDATAVRGVK